MRGKRQTSRLTASARAHVAAADIPVPDFGMGAFMWVTSMRKYWLWLTKKQWGGDRDCIKKIVEKLRVMILWTAVAERPEKDKSDFY